MINERERGASDADIQRIVRTYCYPNQINDVRKAISAWRREDYVYAIDRIFVDVAQPSLRPGSREMFTQLFEEYRVEKRHQELIDALGHSPKGESEQGIKQATTGKSVFVVHGHDTANLNQLDLILRKRYDLDPIILSEQAGKGQTIIEKFEAEAKRADFAFVLLTPDDVIHQAEKQYAQARPNVIFELGWFYGILGRKKVCILCKEGAEIHSDLHGISLINFRKFINEKLYEIDRELVSGGMLTDEKFKSLKDDVFIKYDNRRITSKNDGKKQYFVRDGKTYYLEPSAAKVFDDNAIIPDPKLIDSSELDLLLKEKGSDLNESLSYKLLGISAPTAAAPMVPQIQFETALSKVNIEAVIQSLVRANAPLTEKELANRAPPHDITSTINWCNEGVRLGILSRSQGTDPVRISLTGSGHKYAKSRLL